MLSLKALAEKVWTHKIELRGETVEVRHIPASVHRAIESQLPYPKVYTDDPKKIAEAEARNEPKRYEIEVKRQFVRCAYMLDLEHEGRTWSQDAPPDWVARLAEEVGRIFSYDEINRVYNASLKATEKMHDPNEQIGGAKPGN
jgi:hypothetical protein